MARLAVPVFDNETLCATLVVFVFCVPNVRLVGERLATGAGVTGAAGEVGVVGEVRRRTATPDNCLPASRLSEDWI